MRIHQRRRKRRSSIGRLGLAVVLAGLTAGLAGYLYYIRFEPSEATFPVRGIDVSHHQGDIDWETVKKSGVDFVYMKATEGGDFKDRLFERNWSESARVGIVRGAYHFFTLCKPGAEQAENFIASVPVEDTAMPPAVDLEFGGNCADRPSTAEVLREVLIYLTRLERHYRKKPILYMTAEFHEAYLQGVFEDHAVWLRGIVRKPKYGPADWAFWQYHNKGHRDGIKGPVDLNVFGGDREAFEEFIKSGRPAVPVS